MPVQQNDSLPWDLSSQETFINKRKEHHINSLFGVGARP
jgi:hypothetical protein